MKTRSILKQTVNCPLIPPDPGASLTARRLYCAFHKHANSTVQKPPSQLCLSLPSIIWVCSFRRIQKRIFDPRFARFRGRKEREIRNWICNLGNLSPTGAICTTASQKNSCFLLFDKLCDYTVKNLVVGSSNSDDGRYKTDKERSALKLKII